MTTNLIVFHLQCVIYILRGQVSPLGMSCLFGSILNNIFYPSQKETIKDDAIVARDIQVMKFRMIMSISISYKVCNVHSIIELLQMLCFLVDTFSI